jgi:ATP-independent RNA helicase DbpA
MTTASFSTLALPAALHDNLASLGYRDMTAIQAQSLPLILKGSDVIGKANTGSGKTAAFGLGLLSRIEVKRFRIQALVLCPTRELADQVAKELRRLARAIHNLKILTLCGGTPFGPQVNSLQHGAHIIVGTPGRVEEHARKQNLNVEHLNCFVLDEADRMLDAGFQNSLDAIVNYLPAQRQTLLFSATYPTTIQTMAERIMLAPQIVEVQEQHSTNTIEQVFFEVENDEEQRIKALQLILLKHRPQSTLIFCNTKKETNMLCAALCRDGFSALALHGDLEQKERDKTLVRFAHKSISILVATDVAARGLDIDRLDLVINYQIARELDVHIHRIGRTGRAGEKGLAVTLYSATEKFKADKLAKIMATKNQEFLLAPLPDENLFNQPCFSAPMVTFQIDGGKKQKVRPGDILGALTATKRIQRDDVGKIAIFDYCTYVSVKQNIAADAFSIVSEGKIKGRNFRARRL